MILSILTNYSRVLAPILLLVGVALVSFSLSYILLRIGIDRKIKKKINIYSENALSNLTSDLNDAIEYIIELESKVITQKANIQVMVLHISKALTEGSLDE